MRSALAGNEPKMVNAEGKQGPYFSRSHAYTYSHTDLLEMAQNQVQVSGPTINLVHECGEVVTRSG